MKRRRNPKITKAKSKSSCSIICPTYEENSLLEVFDPVVPEVWGHQGPGLDDVVGLALVQDAHGVGGERDGEGLTWGRKSPRLFMPEKSFLSSRNHGIETIGGIITK